ncbi:DoxX family protein [Ammoniphilus sp. YIM 78166]|uniref:DoxX family protein n=1 Tax=Ammoniphilus sp. YIM 78166 TaxID=1644106 RepID=UPI00107007D7|nr:DoxX family protein [Ammoniphilus sp. YIM 78166]
MEILLIITQVILVCMFTFSASIKFLRKPMMVHHWNEYRYPMWFMFVIATLELTGVLGLLAAFWFQRMVIFAAILFIILMIGAIHAHLFRAKHSPLMAINAVIMLLLSITLIII